MSKLSRKEFIKGAAMGAAGLTMLGISGAVSAAEEAAAELPGKLSSEEFAETPVEIQPITQWDEEYTYDVVVVGAGSGGVGAALAANKAGASVGVLQKGSVAISQGSGPKGIIWDRSSEEGILAFISAFLKDNSYRADRELFKAYLQHSYAAISQAYEAAQEGAAEEPEITFSYTEGSSSFNGYEVATVGLSFAPKPISNMEGVQLLSHVLEKRGAEFFYETPGVQLIVEDGAVTGIFGRNAEGKVIRFNANKGVILATGDYQNNPAMVDKYCPDAYYFDKKQFQKTGDGHLMAIMAGGVMEPLGHTKMLHDFDSGPMVNEPFLTVNVEGMRFMDETTPHETKCNYLRNQPSPGWCTQIFDSNYVEQCEEWGGRPTAPDALEAYIPGMVENPTGVYTYLLDTHKADTLEELAEILDMPADALLASVERYNELCDKGIDSDFGKDPKYLKRIEKGPFYGIRKHFRVSALCSGVLVDVHNRVYDANKEVIPGLYAVGNTSGQFYGGPDYPFTMGGISIGRAYTQGYIAAMHAVENR